MIGIGTVRRLVATIAAVALMAIAGPGAARAADDFIIMQSTTSTQNSGLLDYILPIFTEQTGITVRVVAVGTGQAIRNARNGDGDILLVHAREAEEEFVAQGWGLSRHDLMYNDFVIVGPSADPAGIKDTKDPITALQAIARAKASFVSRGDDSGTHIAEQKLWAQTGVDPVQYSGEWYRETGSGMGATLNVAVESNAYALTDRGTWISFGRKLNHRVLVEGDPRLFNQYGVIVVNPARNPGVRVEGATRLARWLLGPEGQAAIASYTLGEQQLFHPNAGTD